MARRKKGEYPIRKGAPPTLRKRGTFPWDKVKPGEYFVVGKREHPNVTTANREYNPLGKHFMTKTVGGEKRVYCVDYDEWIGRQSKPGKPTKKKSPKKKVAKKNQQRRYPFRDMKIGHAHDIQKRPGEGSSTIPSAVSLANRWAHKQGKHFKIERLNDKWVRIHCVKFRLDHLK